MPSLRTMRRENKELVERMRGWALNLVYAPVRWAWEIEASEFHAGIDMGRLRERVKTASDCGWRSELYISEALRDICGEAMGAVLTIEQNWKEEVRDER